MASLVWLSYYYVYYVQNRFDMAFLMPPQVGSCEVNLLRGPKSMLSTFHIYLTGSPAFAMSWAAFALIYCFLSCPMFLKAAGFIGLLARASSPGWSLVLLGNARRD